MTSTSGAEAQVTEYGIPVRNVWHMLLYAWHRADQLGRWQADVEDAPSLDALLAQVLAAAMEKRLRIGLGREYVDVDRRLRGIRGRVDFNRSLMDRTFERGEAQCRFDSFEVDAPRNQIVRSVLARLVQVGRFGQDSVYARALRGRLRRLVRDLDGVRLVDVNLDLIRRQQLGRNDGDYRLMLSICEFLLESVLQTETAGSRVAPRLDRSTLTLSAVYEKFVAEFYKLHLPGVKGPPVSRGWGTSTFP